MLPSYPKIQKIYLDDALQKIEQRAAELAPIIAMTNKHIQFEGNRTTLFRHDDSVGDTEMKPVTAEVQFERVPLPDIENQREKKILEVAEQKAIGVSQIFYDELGKAAEETGNVVDAGGKSFNEEAILKCLEKMDHTFASDGTWNPPTIIAGGAAFEQLLNAPSNATPASKKFNKSLGDILDKKRNDFRDREASRVLD